MLLYQIYMFKKERDKAKMNEGGFTAALTGSAHSVAAACPEHW